MHIAIVALGSHGDNSTDWKVRGFINALSVLTLKSSLAGSDDRIENTGTR